MHIIPLTLLYGALFVTMWIYGWSPYREFRNTRWTDIRRAKIYHKEHCVNKADIRVQIGDFDHCERAERIMQSNPDYDAWEDLMQSFNICPRGSCLIFKWNLFEVLGAACGIFVALAVAGLGLNVAGTFMSAWQNFRAKSMLPITNNKKMF
jgi:hypothetical protein